MISSTIGELAAERREIAERLDAAQLADGWLFEMHATAAGEPPEARYLDIARRCDLYVIIVAEQGSEATEAEYHAAYGDNPHKIMPFFVGDVTDGTRELRGLIESRHTRVHRQRLVDLAPAVIDAVTDQTRSGEVVRLPLVEILDEHLRRGEQVVTSALPLGFIPILSPSPKPSPTDASQAFFPATTLPGQEHQIVLEGIGGSGKTYSGLAMLRHASSKGTLPVVVQPVRGRLSLDELITSAFEAVRFFPGTALLQQLARDGRLGILVDGIDGLASDDRRIFLGDVDAFVRRFPRSLVICCIRRALPDEVTQFARFTLEPLSEEQTTDMFRSVNVPQVRAFPPQVADLARWPMWAWALLEVGPSVPTGLALLQKLLDHRISRSGSYSPVETELLIDAAGEIAFRAWPQSSMTAHDALSALVSWGTSTSARTRFSARPAETILQRLSAAGIVQLMPDVVFAHPLFATYLGARHAATADPMTDAMAADPEFAMFVAALLGENRTDEKLTQLLRHGPVGQARYLRLVSTGEREAHRDDALVFGTALKTLSGSAAECIVTGNWTAWRTADEPGVANARTVEQWMSDGEVNFLPGNAFENRSPLDLAAIEALARFKDDVTHERPDGDRHERLSDADLKRLRKLPRQELNDLILQAVLDWRRDWREQATRMRISTLPEAVIADGDPTVTVVEEWPDPKLRIEWGGTARVTWVKPEGKDPWAYRPLSTFLDPGRSVRIYNELVERAERAVGCAFGSQAWNRPEYVAAWAW